MLEDKLKTAGMLASIVKKEKTGKKKVVFTNGCFDVLHYGHVKYLEDARKLGDLLVVAVNSDLSVSKIKGPKRPVVAEAARARVIAALESVSYVTLFDQETPLETIRLIVPDVLVKGGDWDEGSIVGSDIVKANGGAVKTIPFVEGYSTTAVIDRIKKL